jgi:hypothetical protein
VTVSIACEASRLQPSFHFTNSIWDEIENVIELGALHAGEVMSLAVASQWLLAFTKEESSEVLTMMAPSDWAYMLDPGESPDVNDALKAIRDSILGSVRIATEAKEEAAKSK